MKWKTTIACLLIISLFAIPAWCDEPLNITEIKDEINVDFEKTDVKKVLKILIETTNLDIVFDECVQGKVTLKVENVPLHNLFRMVMEYAELDYKQNGDKIWITCQDAQNTGSDSHRPRKFTREEQVALVEAHRRSETNPEDLAAAREPLIAYMETHPLNSVPEQIYLLLGQLWYFDEENENHIEEANRIYATGSEMYPDNEDLFLNYAITRRKLGYLQLKLAENGPEKSGDSDIVGMVHSISEVDTPPRLLRVFPPQYPIEAQAYNIEGRVVLRFLVDTDGNAKEPEMVEAVPEEAAIFETSALKAIERYKFKPAMMNDEPVSCIVQMPIVFTLESREANEDVNASSQDNSDIVTIYHMNQVDTPIRVLRAFPPKYPEEAKAEKIEGRVVLRFVVDKDGKAKEPEVVESDPEDVFEAAALEVIQEYKFKPAMMNGEPVACIVEMPVRFELE